MSTLYSAYTLDSGWNRMAAKTENTDLLYNAFVSTC